MASSRHSARLVTVSFVTHAGSVLLVQHRTDGDRFRGLWNGVGGHVEAGEDVGAAARRELREETALDVDLVLRGVVHESGLVGRAHVLFVFTGEASSCEMASPEGLSLRWQPLDRLDELPLVEDVPVLLQRALSAREPFTATEHFEAGDALAQIRFDSPEVARVG